jgi:MoxR-like ATPase
MATARTITVPADELDKVRRLHEAVRAEVIKIVIGMDSVIERLFVVLLSGGNALLEGVPGVAKTTLAKAFAAALGLGFRRIQFTPDLLPGDITGTHVFNMKTQEFDLKMGPIFTHIALADEINRAPAKTQAALLECMQERQVTIEGVTLPLESPFMVLATQNPIEQEGVYPLPEAQVDRFLMKINVGYPAPEAERRMMLHYLVQPEPVRPVASLDSVLALQRMVPRVHVEESLVDYILALAHATRADARVTLGVSPRACLALQSAARARALLYGRDYVVPDDVRELAPDVLHHRMMLTPEAELDGADASAILGEILARVSIPAAGAGGRQR